MLCPTRIHHERLWNSRTLNNERMFFCSREKEGACEDNPLSSDLLNTVTFRCIGLWQRKWKPFDNDPHSVLNLRFDHKSRMVTS